MISILDHPRMIEKSLSTGRWIRVEISVATMPGMTF
jgi:hypothetical protein